MDHLRNHIGVWMDHHQAVFVYPVSKHNYHVEKFISEHDTHPREDGQGTDESSFGINRNSNNEYHKHNKEKDQLDHYYKALEKVLEKYDEILIFGAGTAKDEFFNQLMKSKAFSGKRIEVETADKMNDHQLVAYVKDFYETRTLKS